MPCSYKDKTYDEVMTWTADTKIKYKQPNPKSGKSQIRYGKYMVAKTVGESLAKGSYGLDLLFDYEHGLLWPIGGPKRERPPDLEKMDKEEKKKFNLTDRKLSSMYCKWLSWTATFAALDKSGFTRKDLKDMKNEHDPEGGMDTIIIAAARREAQLLARKILKQVKSEGGRSILDSEVLSVLQLWGFKENRNRENVMPDGHDFVFSDTLGMIKMTTCERTLLTRGTKQYPEVTQLLNKWLQDQLPADLKGKFCYTSINVNKNYAGKLHRDGNNCGPSMIRAVGGFTGGELNYWPEDLKRTPLDDFTDTNPGNKVMVDIRDNLMLFDGNRGHHVSKFDGDRLSVVFFSIRTWNKITKEDAVLAKEWGLPLPTKESMEMAQQLLGKKEKDGFRVWPNTEKRGVKRKSCAKDGDAIIAATPTPCRPSKALKSDSTKCKDDKNAPAKVPEPSKTAVQKKLVKASSGESKTKILKVKKVVKKANTATPVAKIAKAQLKMKKVPQPESFSQTAKIQRGTSTPSPYIKQRCDQLVGKTVKEALEKFQYKDASGETKKYKMADLRYDVKGNNIVLKE